MFTRDSTLVLYRKWNCCYGILRQSLAVGYKLPSKQKFQPHVSRKPSVNMAHVTFVTAKSVSRLAVRSFINHTQLGWITDICTFHKMYGNRPIHDTQQPNPAAPTKMRNLNISQDSLRQRPVCKTGSLTLLWDLSCFRTLTCAVRRILWPYCAIKCIPVILKACSGPCCMITGVLQDPTAR
jgi:hypothetical protein